MDNIAFIHIFVSTVLFIIVWKVLRTHLFKSFFALLEEREARTTGDEEQARQKKEESRAILGQVENILHETKLKALSMRDEETIRAKKEAHEIISHATLKAQTELEKARAQIRQERSSIDQEMEQEAEKLAELVLQRITATETGPLIH